MKKFFAWLMMSFGLFFSAQATHIVGNKLHYEQIGTDTIRVYNTNFYDCSGAAFAASVPVSNGVLPQPPFVEDKWLPVRLWRSPVKHDLEHRIFFRSQCPLPKHPHYL